jgi:hypothetical protein
MITEYETQSTLNPKLWDGERLRPKLRAGFVKIAKAFYDFLETDAEILDIIIIGSSANYNWTEHSDIDLHVVINYLQVGDNLHLVNNYMHAKKSVWNNNYPLTYKGMNIELYAQDSNQEMHSTVGSYSLLHDKWIQQPNSETISVDDAAIQQKAEPYEYEIDSLQETDPLIQHRIENIKQRLRHLRQTGLEAEGEYSIENMAYKHLRNTGYLERLKRLEQQVTMGRLAVERTVNERESSKFRHKTSEYTGKAKQQAKHIVSAVKTESAETKQALAMILQYLNGEKLTSDEWKWIRRQMGDVVKLLGLTTMAVAPGGTLVAILAKALKADKYLLPSAFKSQDDVIETLRMHISGEHRMDAAGWQGVMQSVNGIADPAGQWKHPGKCTMIPSNQITMKHVKVPVLGIDDTGHAEYMQPGETYTYPGKQVFEIPHTAQWQTMIMQLRNAMQNGGRYAK